MANKKRARKTATPRVDTFVDTLQSQICDLRAMVVQLAGQDAPSEYAMGCITRCRCACSHDAGEGGPGDPYLDDDAQDEKEEDE